MATRKRTHKHKPWNKGIMCGQQNTCKKKNLPQIVLNKVKWATNAPLFEYMYYLVVNLGIAPKCRLPLSDRMSFCSATELEKMDFLHGFEIEAISKWKNNTILSICIGPNRDFYLNKIISMPRRSTNSLLTALINWNQLHCNHLTVVISSCLAKIYSIGRGKWVENYRSGQWDTVRKNSSNCSKLENLITLFAMS